MQFYVHRTYLRWVHRAFSADRHMVLSRAILILLGVGNTLLVLQFLLRSYNSYANPVSQYLVIYPGGIFFGMVLLGFLIVVIKDSIRFLVYWIQRIAQLAVLISRAESTTVDAPVPQQLSEGRRQFLKLSGATAGTPFIASIASAHDYRIVRLPLRFPNLPAGLHGVTIAQVSDVHSGVYMTERDIRDIVQIVNGLHPSLIALTGDHVDNNDAQLPAVCNSMKLLKSEYGVYGCLGNHDHFATAEKVTAALRQINVTMLDNAHRTLTINGEKLSIVGVDDAGRGSGNFANIDEAIKGLDPEGFSVLLSHRPDFFTKAKSAGMDLTLSGHTHGGQVGIEFWRINLNPVYLVHKYARGLYQEDGKQLYVNVGVGMVGVPIRLVPPEITLITLLRG
jgi:predicted MPP superfamily phosphohydrolase